DAVRLHVELELARRDARAVRLADGDVVAVAGVVARAAACDREQREDRECPHSHTCGVWYDGRSRLCQVAAEEARRYRQMAEVTAGFTVEAWAASKTAHSTGAPTAVHCTTSAAAAGSGICARGTDPSSAATTARSAASARALIAATSASVNDIER